MGALPKKKTSKARKGERRSHLRIKVPHLVRCAQCRNLRLTHHACPICGYYSGRQAVVIPDVTPRGGA